MDAVLHVVLNMQILLEAEKEDTFKHLHTRDNACSALGKVLSRLNYVCHWYQFIDLYLRWGFCL